jgi:transcriptional regulator with XRE-family HTH domain
MKRTLVEQLQGAIRASGLTLNELERRCGVSHAVLSRFLTGKRTLTLPLAAKVCETLGLELRPAGAPQDVGRPDARPASRRRRKGGTSS